MKKIVTVFAVIAGVSFSGNVLAAGTEIPVDGVVSTTACTLLADQVTINLSANVNAAYQCDTAAAAIRVGTCHVAGSRAPGSITCANLSDVTGEFIPNAEGCTAGNIGTSVESADFSGFFATSRGGSVAEVPLGGSCNETSVTTLTGFN